jgi:hypothetical protein
MLRTLLQTFAFLAALALATAPAAGDEPKKDGGKTDPAGVPLEARLISKKDSYTLDLGGKSAKEFRKLLDDEKNTRRFPEPPKVDLVLEFKNTGKEEIKYRIGPDGAEPMLELKGEGAATVDLGPNLSGRRSIEPKVITLAPGKTYEWPIQNLKSLSSSRPQHQSYWTEPGEYTLTADVQTQVSPVPKGSKDKGDGFGDVKITSAAVTVKVVEGK